jgi:putative acetyltransferase
MQIRLDDLSEPEVKALLDEHLRDMALWSPPDSVHALDLESLRKPDISFWTAWSNDELLGCGALRQLDPQHGEIKSMRTSVAHRRRGVARAILRHMMLEAQQRSYKRLSLEIGSVDGFQPAQQLFRSFGFELCGPFADYKPDPNSVFMTKAI